MNTWTPSGHTCEDDLTAMKREILDGILSGQISPRIDGFVDLNDYIDANCLGGYCADDEFAKLVDSDGVMLDEALDYMNSLTAVLHEWIYSGHMLLDLLDLVREKLASSSEMLAALEFVLPFIPEDAHVCTDPGRGISVYAEDVVSAAIAKAKGVDA